MELLDVVDEYGNLTGEVMDREKVHDLNLLHWEVAVFIINDKKQVLLQKRAATKRFNPNKWGLCAGHVDSGEENEDNFKLQIEELSEVKWFNIDDVIKMIENNDESLTLKYDRLYLLEKLKEL